MSTRGIRHALEYQAARAGLALLESCPRTAGSMAAALADVAFLTLSSRRQTACENLLRAGVASNATQARQIARASFRHLGSVAVESALAVTRLRPDNWRESVVVDAHPEAMSLIEAPRRGVIITTGHLGNWEVGGHVLSFMKPTVAVARPMNNPRVQRLLEQHGARGRMQIIPKHSANPMRLVRALRSGQALALMIDQHARQHAEWVDFLGRPAATHTSPALLHLLTGAPLIPIYVVRTAFLKYRFVFEAPMEPPSSSDRRTAVRELTQALTRRLEAAIRTYPEQYLWVHRRWRPPPADLHCA